MKTWIRNSIAATTAVLVATCAIGQDKTDKKVSGKADKSQEIIIRKKGGNSEKMTIVVDGENITINGKPADEFKNENVTIFKRNGDLLVHAPRVRRLNNLRELDRLEDLNGLMTTNTNKAMLGVLYEKAEDGVRITEVTKESGADKAGLKKDDIITKIGDIKIEETEDLVKAIGDYKPNDKVEITYKRNGKENKASAVLGENKVRAYSFNINDRNFNFNVPHPPTPPSFENFNFEFSRKPKVGLQIQDVEEGKGAKVKDVDEDSPASKAGLKEGDIITGINGKEIAGVDELRNEMRDVKEGESLKFSFKRDGKTQTAEVKVPKRLKTADL